MADWAEMHHNPTRNRPTGADMARLAGATAELAGATHELSEEV